MDFPVTTLLKELCSHNGVSFAMNAQNTGPLADAK